MESGDWLEAAPWPLALLDGDHRFIAANRRFCDLLGRSRAELCALPYSAIGIADDDAHELAAWLALARGAAAVSVDKRLVRADGSQLAVRLEVQALADSAPGTARIFCLRPAEQGAGAVAGLEREVERLRRALGQASACTAHDLREQARLAASFLGVLDVHHRGALPPGAQELLERVRGHAGRLLALLPALAGYLRAAAQPAALGATDSAAVLARAAARLAPLGDATRAVLSQDALPTLAADALALEEIFVRLLDNAVVHHPPGLVRIHVGCRRAGGEWQFAVADDGQGLPTELHARLFLPFAAGPGVGGLGLGLAHCRMDIERMGGRIWLDPAAGGGACIRFALPA
jgi:PAS domain S-box-containing protein